MSCVREGAPASTAIRSILEPPWNPGEKAISRWEEISMGRKVAQKLTQRFVETVTAGQNNRSEYRDGHTRGLVLRVTPKGIKSWAVLYRRKSDGRKRRYTIGTYPEFSLADARTQAEAIVARVSRGEDPAAQVQARNAALTFEQLAETWVIRHGRPNKGARSLYDDQLMLKREINPAIGGMKADEVSKLNIIGILEAVAAVVPAIGRTGCLRWCDPSIAGASPRTSSISIQHRACGHVLLSAHVSGSFLTKNSAPSGTASTMRRWARRSPPSCALPW